MQLWRRPHDKAAKAMAAMERDKAMAMGKQKQSTGDAVGKKGDRVDRRLWTAVVWVHAAGRRAAAMNNRFG